MIGCSLAVVVALFVFFEGAYGKGAACGGLRPAWCRDRGHQHGLGGTDGVSGRRLCRRGVGPPDRSDDHAVLDSDSFWGSRDLSAPSSEGSRSIRWRPPAQCSLASSSPSRRSGQVPIGTSSSLRSSSRCCSGVRLPAITSRKKRNDQHVPTSFVDDFAGRSCLRIFRHFELSAERRHLCDDPFDRLHWPRADDGYRRHDVVWPGGVRRPRCLHHRISLIILRRLALDRARRGAFGIRRGGDPDRLADGAHERALSRARDALLLHQLLFPDRQHRGAGPVQRHDRDSAARARRFRVAVGKGQLPGGTCSFGRRGLVDQTHPGLARRARAALAARWPGHRRDVRRERVSSPAAGFRDRWRYWRRFRAGFTRIRNAS